MLIINNALFEEDTILKVECGNNWDGNDSMLMLKCALDQIKHYLLLAQQDGKRMILLCDCTKGTFPPIARAMQVVTYMHGLKPILKRSLSHTVIYVKSEKIKTWIDEILKVYKPVRPINMVTSKEAIKECLLNSSSETGRIEQDDEEGEQILVAQEG